MIVKEHKLKSDKGPDIVITAELVGSVDTKESKKDRNGRWLQYDCYRTEAGTLVVHKQGYSDVQEETARYEVFPAKTDQELVEQVGHSAIAKLLYETCKIDHHKRID